MYSNLTHFWKGVHFLAIPLVWGIIYINTSCFTTYYALNPRVKFTFWSYLLCICFYFCALMTMICHTISICTDPGSLNQNLVRNLKEKTFCKKCNKERPLRTHHCSTCGMCVLKLDHHCPWIFNCVGYYNQKTFFLFLTYATIGDFLSFLGLLFRILDPSFVNMILYPKRKFNPKGNIMFEIIMTLKDPLWIIIGLVLSVAMTLAIGGLLGRQIYLLLNNMTNVETSIYEKKDHCPFYAYQDKWFMMKTVLGLGSKWKWFLPIMEENKYNEGYKFDTPYTRKKEIKRPKEHKCGNCKDKETTEEPKDKDEKKKD